MQHGCLDLLLADLLAQEDLVIEFHQLDEALVELLIGQVGGQKLN